MKSEIYRIIFASIGIFMWIFLFYNITVRLSYFSDIKTSCLPKISFTYHVIWTFLLLFNCGLYLGRTLYLCKSYGLTSSFFFCTIIISFWNQGYTSLLKWLGQCFLLYFLKEFVIKYKLYMPWKFDQTQYGILLARTLDFSVGWGWLITV